jgi:hypothetical protein
MPFLPELSETQTLNHRHSLVGLRELRSTVRGDKKKTGGGKTMMNDEKARDIISLKEDIRNLLNCMTDMIEIVGVLQSKVDDMLMDEVVGLRFSEGDTQQENFELEEPAEVQSMTVTLTPEVVPQKLAPELPPMPEPPVPEEQPKKQGLFNKLRGEPKIDKDKESRAKLLKDLEKEIDNLKKRR